MLTLCQFKIMNMKTADDARCGEEEKISLIRARQQMEPSRLSCRKGKKHNARPIITVQRSRSEAKLKTKRALFFFFLSYTSLFKTCNRNELQKAGMRSKGATAESLRELNIHRPRPAAPVSYSANLSESR